MKNIAISVFFSALTIFTEYATAQESRPPIETVPALHRQTHAQAHRVAAGDPTLTASPHTDTPNGKPKFDIRGQRIGDTINTAWAYSHCPNGDLEDHLGYVNAPDQAPFLVENGKDTDGNITGLESIAFGDKAVYVYYTFHDRKLYDVDMDFDSSLYGTMKKTYADKFGVQPTIISSTVTTPLGVSYANETATWDTDSGQFVLQKYGSDIDNGFGVLLTPEIVKAAQEKKAIEEKDLKSKL